MFSECLGRAPSLILLNANYVTKVVFPLEVLPLTVVLGSLVHLLIGAMPLCLAAFIARSGHLHAAVNALAAVAHTDHFLGVGHHVAGFGAGSVLA